MQITKELLVQKNNYCVYLHKRADDGVVFYIGSGVQNKREKHFISRSKSWHEVKDKYGIVVEVFRKDLDKNTARELEQQLIDSGEYPFIVNQRVVAKSYPSLTKNVVEDYVYYDESSPTYLRWKKVTGPRCKINEQAGNLCFTKDGKPRSSSIKVNSRDIKLARVIWALFNQEVPEDMVIDHMDNNPHNNKIENLRCITIAENSRNRARNHNSKSESAGICKTKHGYSCSVVINGEKFSASYSFGKYGEDAINKAMAWRKSLLLKANELGAGYTDNHIPEIDDGIDYSRMADGYFKTKGLWARKDSDGNVSHVVACVKFNGKKRIKAFSIHKYGLDTAKSLAIELVNKGDYTEEDFEDQSKIKVRIQYIDNSEIVGDYPSLKSSAIALSLSYDLMHLRLTGKLKSNMKYQGREIKIIRLSQNN